MCEKESVYYVIRLKSDAQLQQIAEEYRPTSLPSDVTKTECYFEETIYQAKSCKNVLIKLTVGDCLTKLIAFSY
jgi:hypothetical protein